MKSWRLRWSNGLALLPAAAQRRVQTYQRAQIAGIGLRERELRHKQVTIGLNHIEVRGIADSIARQGDCARTPQRIDLIGLLALLLAEFLVSDQGIGHVLESTLNRLLVL